MANTAAENLTSSTAVQRDDSVLILPSGKDRLHQACAGEAYFGTLEWFAARIAITDGGGGNNAFSIVNDATYKKHPLVASVAATSDRISITLNSTLASIVGSVILKPDAFLAGKWEFGPSVTTTLIATYVRAVGGSAVNPITTTGLRTGHIWVLGAFYPIPR